MRQVLCRQHRHRVQDQQYHCRCAEETHRRPEIPSALALHRKQQHIAQQHPQRLEVTRQTRRNCHGTAHGEHTRDRHEAVLQQLAARHHVPVERPHRASHIAVGAAGEGDDGGHFGEAQHQCQVGEGHEHELEKVGPETTVEAGVPVTDRSGEDQRQACLIQFSVVSIEFAMFVDLPRR